MPASSADMGIPIDAVSYATYEWKPLIPAEVAADVEDATRALVEFDRHARSRLGSDNPALGPMAAILLRAESASSSQIEQLTTSAKQLAIAEIDEAGGLCRSAPWPHSGDDR